MNDSALETVLKRDRLVVLAGLAGVTLVSWVYLVDMARDMAAMSMPMNMGDAVAMTRIRPWTTGDFVMMFTMWAVMMVGMMTPTAAPMVLVFARYNRQQQGTGRPYVSTGAFLTGYLIAWTGFSLVATVLQWALDQAALLSPMMVSTSPLLGGSILIGAGVFQLTPAKNACLAHCRSPLQFFMENWRSGTAGALRMGIEHGVYCLGCCWILMGLLFFGGVMNLLWIATITIFVLAEKALPFGVWVGRVGGVLMAFFGLFIIFQG